jgi:hypothetical protein
MVVQFQSDASINKAGFTLKYTTSVDPPTADLNCTGLERVSAQRQAHAG